MNLKYISLTLITIMTSIQCFAVEHVINNPFKDIDIKISSQNYQTDTNSDYTDPEYKNQIKKVRTFLKQKERQKYFYDKASNKEKPKAKEAAYSVEIQLKIKDPKTGGVVYLTKRRFNPLQGDMPSSIYFQDHFMLHGKSGKIAYTIDPEGSCKNQKYIIESVRINILEASINGNLWPKKTSNKKLCEVFK